LSISQNIGIVSSFIGAAFDWVAIAKFQGIVNEALLEFEMGRLWIRKLDMCLPFKIV